MPVLKALKGFSYNKQKLRAGDIFKCKDKHVAMLCQSRLAAKPDMVEDPNPIQLYQTRHMEAARPVVKDRSDMTVAELRAEAETKEIHLPSGYVTKSELVDILSKA